MKQATLTITDYQPLCGFEDLRQYDLPKDVFLKCWNAQRFLHQVQEQGNERKNKNKENPDKHIPRHTQWNQIQEVSAMLQQIIFSYKHAMAAIY